MKQTIRQPCRIIRTDRYTGKVEPPSLLLMNRTFQPIGKIGRFENWHVSLSANALDEICFEVHKFADGKPCPVWDMLTDLKIVYVEGFGKFEISVDYTDSAETVKFIHGVSLETELTQIMLRDFYVNDADAGDMSATDYSNKDIDKEETFTPTVFYNQKDPEHSLLHRVLADKAPHWSIGYVTPCIALDEEEAPEPVSSFQRSFTADGESIYDFLTETVAKECNVAFLFDTIDRKINCYSLCEDAFDPETGNLTVAGIGEDTAVLVSKTRLSSEITLSSNKDGIKNCFRVEGGDDMITDLLRAVNPNGSGYVYRFSQFQYDDMPKALRERLQEYQAMMEDQNTQDAYYGENGIYTRLCRAYDDLARYESAMMPEPSGENTPADAKEQYEALVAKLTAKGFSVAVSSVNTYNDNLFAGVTNNIETYAQILTSSGFDVKILRDTASYHSSSETWHGKFQVIRHAGEKDAYPADASLGNIITIKVTKDPAAFARQKIEKELAKGSMLGVDLSVAEMNEQDLLNHFRQYSLNRLKSFYDGYNSCISVLIGLGKTETSDSQDPLYSRYETRLKTVEQAMEERKADIENVNGRIQTLESEQKEFLYGSSAMAQPLFSYQPHDLKTCLGSLYAEFCKYRREDAYTNNSYTSEGLDTAECLEKAKELLDAAHREAKKACRLQRTASASLHNLFALPEFEPLYDKFALYNYIRIRTEDEVLKLRIAGIEFHGETAHEVQVTFAEHVDVVSSTAQTVRQTLQQAAQMSESYPSTVLQAEKGNQAEQKLQEIETNGLDAGKNMVTNSENNEITITRSGIIGKCMNDEGSYGDRQFRITGNTMAFTDDNWKSVRVAIGENTFRHPLTESKETQYGIFAENIIGNLIAGNKLYIGTKDKSVCITENGIKIDKGTISWNGVNPPGMGDISGLSEFKRKVNAALTGSPTTEIGSDYVISPKIGGGYLKIKDQRNVPNNAGVGVEINPKGTRFKIDEEYKEYIFNITKHNKTDLIIGVDKHGDGYFKGCLQSGGNFSVDKAGNVSAKSGMLGGWNINTSKLVCNSTTGGVLELNAEHGSIYSISDNCKATLTSGYIGFEYNSNKYVKISVTHWVKNPTVHGVGIHSESNSKFISFGNKNSDADETYITPLVLNYGLNPNGDTQDILLYGSVYARDSLYFNSNTYLSSTNTNSISCNRNFVVDNNLNVGNNLDIGNNLIVWGNLRVHGALERPFDSTPNLCIGGEGRIAKTTGSSKKFKTEIKPIVADELNPEKLYDIDVVQYKFKKDYLSEKAQRYNKYVIGFIAEDIFEKYPVAADCSIDDEGNTVVNDWNFRYIVPAMLKLIQDQKKEIIILKKESESIMQQLKSLMKP